MTKKLIKTLIIILLMISSFNVAIFAGSSEPQVVQDIKIFKDGIEFKTDKPVYIFNGNTLVPMRAIFEQLGAEVTWDAEKKAITARTEDKNIELSIDSKAAKVNDQEHLLSIAPKLINSTTYVPLRFIAESLMYEVDWNGENKIISIINTQDIKALKQLKVYESSSNFKDDYIKMEIVDNERIRVEGRSGLGKTNWSFMVKKSNNNDIISEYLDVKSNGSYEGTFNLRNKLKDGEYYVDTYFSKARYSTYWSYYWNIPLENRNGEIFFLISPVYENNYVQFLKNSVIETSEYLDLSIIRNESERNQIESLAKEITKGTNSEYEKLLKINDWVAQNIYYDWDAYLTGGYVGTSPYETLQNKRSVCQGYAELTNALIRSVGIPSRIVVGHALGGSAGGGYWDVVDHTKSNHAWNEALIDGRWIILDTTWNSRNKYQDGSFENGDMIYRYFDPSLEVFSYTHKILKITK
ncbi:Transglutaminase-like superfamily protein [Proteiniborus ethanoligenes]|uniref:Transglutaminase-like superfamily protein n=1 Tax=Proteiniborus ethanoligenes TaxID=415015 RepID=A0A1H3LZ14_9FIRM|nr:stalk domain-containing protein [Proteiniborus ethanoligenes]SDY69563.1 Transglutaminase-like superfamily protein [Proteiniborus ethanoligenes]